MVIRYCNFKLKVTCKFFVFGQGELIFLITQLPAVMQVMKEISVQKRRAHIFRYLRSGSVDLEIVAYS